MSSPTFIKLTKLAGKLLAKNMEILALRDELDRKEKQVAEARTRASRWIERWEREASGQD